MIKTSIIAIALCMAGCTQTTVATVAIDTAQISDRQAFTAARSQLLATLKDPDSAKFGAFTRKSVKPALSLVLLGYGQEQTDLVCGTVNSKNSFGGYVGTSVFAYRVSRQDVFVDSSETRYGSMWCVDSSPV